MAYNKDRRRGITTKHQKRKKLVHENKKLISPIAHNGIYPYLLAFIEWGGVKGLSINTLKQREVGLQRWILWCDDRGLDDPKAITKPIIERYQKHLYYCRQDNGQPLSVRYQVALLLPIKSFFKWLAQNNRILYNPASEIELPKVPTRLPQSILSVEEVERVMNVPDTNTVYGVRDRAMLETLYSTGIRRTECAELGLYDVDSQRQTVMVRQGKGGKDRLLPIGKRALYWVEKYRDDVRPELVIDRENTCLFLTDYGEPFIKGRLGALVKRYLHHAEIDKPGGCHLFRHAMATHMLDNGADLRFIQMMLGHSQLSTTEIYTHVSIEKLREIHTATHPAKLVVDKGNTDDYNAM
jgi:integrase/recombinase XerD